LARLDQQEINQLRVWTPQAAVKLMIQEPYFVSQPHVGPISVSFRGEVTRKCSEKLAWCLRKFPLHTRPFSLQHAF
jgi:hypothetical protein